MSVAIISDVHNNEVNLKKVLDFCVREKIETIICCGDLASKDTLDFLCANFSGAVHYTFGNMDSDQLRSFELADKYKNVTIYKKFGETEIDGKRIAFTHYPDIAKELCLSRGSEAALRDQTGKYKFVFHGHTHKPWEEMVGSCKMLNPGNVAGEIYPPTFAVWETEVDKFSLIRIHDLK